MALLVRVDAGVKDAARASIMVLCLISAPFWA
jgi:hypothetical protein